jgi:CheY-like chemotaxis protein
VQKGFLRLRAAEVEGVVHISVEDSGPGIPPEKRVQLFEKFQESLDSLNQGTGIGLSLCKNLAELMNAEIWFDESYDSGVDGCPGSRFVINLKKPPLRIDDKDLDGLNPRGDTSSRMLVRNGSDKISVVTAATEMESSQGDTEMESSQGVAETPPGSALPASLSVLFVDDDFVLRKLFVRAVKKVAPEWKVQEAANGETSVRKVEDGEVFDLIFMDQYMASVEKQLLGTESTRALRSKGVTCKICGLSANDTRDAFLEAGANAFMMKPFPCDKERLTRELLRVLYNS